MWVLLIHLADGKTENLKRFKEPAQYHTAECIKEGFLEEMVGQQWFSIKTQNIKKQKQYCNKFKKDFQNGSHQKKF